MPTCIYCHQLDRPFTREHVVPEGFGRFRGALVIHNAVCDQCNQEFGCTIDRALTRSSVEGLERYRFGVKQPSEIDKFTYGKVILRAKIEGDFAGAQFEQRADAAGQKLVAHLVPAVAVRRSQGEGFVHFTESELIDGSWLQNPEVNWRLGFKVFGGSAALKRLEAILDSQGVVPAVRRPLTPPEDGEVTVEQLFEVTHEMQRALAKIAFNYLAYCEGADYVLSEDFDSIRNFVRYGQPPSFSVPPVLSHEGLPFTTINARNVVLQDGPERPVVHFVGVGFNSEYRNVAAGITLFAFMTHRVVLAEAFPGRPPPPRAHLYNVAMRQVFELGAAGEANSRSPLVSR